MMDHPKANHPNVATRRTYRHRIETWIASPVLFGGLIYWGGGYVFRRYFSMPESEARSIAALLALLGIVVSGWVSLKIVRQEKERNQ
jgi:hypothetical protein